MFLKTNGQKWHAHLNNERMKILFVWRWKYNEDIINYIFSTKIMNDRDMNQLFAGQIMSKKSFIIST